MDDTDLTYPEIRAGTAAMKCRTKAEPLYNGSLGVRQPFSPHRSHFVSRIPASVTIKLDTMQVKKTQDTTTTKMSIGVFEDSFHKGHQNQD